MNAFTGSDSEYLHWDAGLDPLLAQVTVGRDVTVVWGAGQQEDDRQDVVSTWNAGEAKNKEDPLLERTPGPQKQHGLLVILHFPYLRPQN